MTNVAPGPDGPLKLNRPVTCLADDVAEVLRAMILRGDLQAGERLLQIQLAEQLGVSRTPLREAFRLLESEGLLRISNGNKTVEVVDVDRDSLIETFQLREVIDGLSARLAARQGLSDSARRRAEELLDRMEGLSRQPEVDLAAYGEAHSEFHLVILDASGNSRLGEFGSLIKVSTQLQLTRFIQNLGAGSTSMVPQALKLSNEEHRELLGAVVSRQPEEAEHASVQHAKSVLRLLHDAANHDDSEHGASGTVAG